MGGGVFDVNTIFDNSLDSSSAAFYKDYVARVLEKNLPSDLKDGKKEGSSGCESIRELVPLLRAEVWGDQQCKLNIELVCFFRPHISKFFQEMVSKWLLPGENFELESFFSSKFQLNHLRDTKLLLTQCAVSLRSEKDLERVRRNLLIWENELFLGLESFHQASRILEVKGLTRSDKNSTLQDYVSHLVQKKGSFFDFDLFGALQQFLLVSQEGFIRERECFQLLRVIYTSYLFQKNLKVQLELDASQRYVYLRVSRIRSQLPYGTRDGLSLFVGINFIHKNEVFDEHHLMLSVSSYLSGVHLIEESVFVLTGTDEKMIFIYLEIEKKNGSNFSSEEISLLRAKLPGDLKNHVERLMPVVFMPRNEEEVLKNILILSQELRYYRDLPQVIISFERQEENELIFTVIVLRLLLDSSVKPILQMYLDAQTRFEIFEDKVKKVGMLRGKYPKEATVLRFSLPKDQFLREDFSLDLLKARQEVVVDLQSVIGDFRDYNGGMIAKQNEVLEDLKKSFPNLDKKDILFLENFFHSIFPAEARTLIASYSIKRIFKLILTLLFDDYRNELVDKSHGCTYSVLKSAQPFPKEEILTKIKAMNLSSCQAVTVFLPYERDFIFASILFEEERSVVMRWDGLIRNIRESLLEFCMI